MLKDAVEAALPEALRDRLHQLRLQLGDAERRLRDVRTQTEAAMTAMGMLTPTPQDQAPIIDVGPASSSPVVAVFNALARACVRGLSFVAGVVLLGAALWSLGIFVSTALLAFVVVTRGMGLRVDVGAAQSA